MKSCNNKLNGEKSGKNEKKRKFEFLAQHMRFEGNVSDDVQLVPFVVTTAHLSQNIHSKCPRIFFLPKNKYLYFLGAAKKYAHLVEYLAKWLTAGDCEGASDSSVFGSVELP